MIFDVILAFREGRPIPRHQIAMIGHVRGMLLVQQEWWEERQRHTLTATLTNMDGGDRVRPLRDAVLQTTDSEYMTISGLEVIEGDGVLAPQTFAQAWVMCIALKRDLNEIRHHLEEAKRLHMQAAEKAGFGPKRAG